MIPISTTKLDGLTSQQKKLKSTIKSCILFKRKKKIKKRSKKVDLIKI